ncbi:GIY-YIG nuclease family protein [Ekhidna sp.]|uniref:GIY-YIG nuclease family protein n=1 Tax=Ekhidna sp. TaxID=2608089 RepID=UPI003C7B748A
MTAVYYFNWMERGGVVYILTNRSNTTLYVGATSDLYPRIVEHREKKYPGSFTARYNISKLVYYEALPTITEAIDREKQLKGGSRKKKEDLINSVNPKWRDLFDDISRW